jgi:hypothetical protein
MQVMRDSASIRGPVGDPTLAPLIVRLVEDLDDYDCDLSAMVRVVVVEPGDALSTIDAELGFPLVERPLDSIEVHPGWFELTYVLSDDGFGVVVYVPVHPDVDPRLIQHCRESIQ